MKILFLAPHAAIWSQSFPEALIARSAERAGHRVVHVGCGGMLERFCITMSAFGLNEDSTDMEKAETCRRCKKAKHRLRRSFRFSGGDLEDGLRPIARAEVESVLRVVRPENVLEVEVLGVPVGRFAFYEFLLARKKSDLSFNEIEWKHYLIALRNCALATIAFAGWLDREKPDRVVTYNSLYSVHRACASLAEARGIPAYFMHAGGNLSNRLTTMMLGRGTTVRFLRHAIERWEGIRETPCAPRELSIVTNHILELFKGSNVFVYSSPASKRRVDIRERLGVRPGQRLVVATMSSYDERFAAETVLALDRPEKILFPTQIEWIRALIAHARRRSDLHVVVRVHPREFPNKREQVTSEHAVALQVLFVDLPGNVSLDLPSGGISLYDLAQSTDVFLNAWSSAGKEMALLGLPVVCYAPQLLFYPPGLNYSGTDHDEYFSAIDCALADGWSAERMRVAYRWCALEFCRGLIDLSDGFSDSSQPATIIRRIFRRLSARFVEDPDQLLDCLSRPERLGAEAVIADIFTRGVESQLDSLPPAPPSTLADETAALRQEAGRIVRALFGAADAAEGPLGLNLARFAAGTT